MRLLAAAALALGALAAPAAAAFELQSHRGGRGLWPENSLTAFAGSLALGVSVLELDTRLTADDVVVIHHDARLNPELTRGPDGTWINAPTPLIRDLSAAALAAYDVGRADPASRHVRRYPDQRAVDDERIPTLAQLFAMPAVQANPGIRFNIETKIDPRRPEETASPERIVERLLATIDAAGMAGRVTIQSFDWRTLRLVRARRPGIPTVHLSAQQQFLDTIQAGSGTAGPWTDGIAATDHDGSVPRMVKAAGGAVWSPFWRDPTDADLAEARRLGLPVVVWTVNAAEDMARLIDRGVDGIITDRPDILRRVMEQRGMAVPAPR